MTSSVTVSDHDGDMPSLHDHIDNYAECAVCRTDTLLLCSPCGDPVCANCCCPNGCEAAPVYWGGLLNDVATTDTSAPKSRHVSARMP